MSLKAEVNRLKKIVAARRTNPTATANLNALKKDRAAVLTMAGVTPDRWQRDMLRERPHRGIALCSRQSGKSTFGAGDALATALTESNALVLVLAPTLRQSQELFRKAVGLWRSLGKPVGADSVSKTTIEFSNGSRIIALPGDGNNLVGFSNPRLVILDEASRALDELYHSIRPMLALGGRLLLTSTPFGPRGFFFNEWSEGGAAWHRVQVRAADCPRISKAFLDDERRALGPKWYAQEYETSFESAAGAVFDPVDIRAACRTPDWLTAA